MPKIEEKQKIVQKIQQKFEDATLVVLADYRGLNVEEITELRNKLRTPGVEVKVLKNTMLRFAMKNMGYDEAINYLEGPNLVLFSNDNPVEPAKIMYDFAKEHKNLQIKVGVLEGQTVTSDKIKDLAELPSREVLIAQVLGTMQAPISSFVRVLDANITGFARVVDQIREQKQAS